MYKKKNNKTHSMSDSMDILINKSSFMFSVNLYVLLVAVYIQLGYAASS